MARAGPARLAGSRAPRQQIETGRDHHDTGIDRDEAGTFYVSDYHKNVVYRITSDKRVEALPGKLKTPADISLDRANNRLLIPLMTANDIRTFDLSENE